MYWSPKIDGVNKVKPEAGKRSRITKAYQVNKVKPQILIVGNSRVQMGLDPNNKNFEGKAVYNQGMPGASVAMQVDYAIDAISNNDTIEQLVVGVDFLDFLLSDEQVAKFKAKQNNHTQTSYDFRLTSQDKDNFAGLLRLKEKLAMIFSLDAFNASISTVIQQRSMTSSISPLGFNSALSYVAIMNSEGIKPLFKQKLHEISARLSSNDWVIKAQQTAPYSPTFTHLGRLIQVAKQRKIKVTFFINPYHFSYLHTIADNNQWHNFQVWKETLVHYLNVKQGEEFILWDFSGSSNFVNEAVPLAKPKQKMKWFWEPAHYNKELGDMLLASMFLEQVNNSVDFGVRLTKKSIETLLKRDKTLLQSHSPQWELLQKKL